MVSLGGLEPHKSYELEKLMSCECLGNALCNFMFTIVDLISMINCCVYY